MSFVKRLCRTIVASALLFLSAAPMHAGIDTATYDAVNGIVCKNMWLKSRVLDATEFEQLPFISNYNRVRTATIYGTGENAKAILGYSKPIANADGETIYTAHIIIIDLATGEYEKEVKLSCNGADITGLHCCNQIGVDDFGNLYFGGYVSDILTTPLKIYHITDIDNGTTELAGELSIPSEEVEALNLTTAQRIDHFDICGDITGQQSHAIVMAALQSSTKVCRWRLVQGMSDWYGDFDGYVTWDDYNLETSPVNQSEWGASPIVHICTNEFDGGLEGYNFYVDGFTTYPVIYNTDGGVFDSFMNAPEDLIPKTDTNGVTEFSVGSKLFIAYSLAQYNGTPGCQIRVAELVDQAFTNMQSYWELPADGLGTTNDGGTRIHSLSTMKITDENGLEGVYLLNYKCNNGIGLYLIAQNGFIDPYTGEAVTAPEDTTPEVTPTYSIALSTNSASIMQGESMQLSATVSPEGSAVTYTSLDEAVATVSESGLITAVAEGQTSIIAALSDNTAVADTCVVTVLPAAEVTPTYSIALSTNSASITQGESMQLSATVSPEGSAVAYTSLDEAVATVSESGLITAVAEGQTSIIAALSDNTAVADTCVVTVIPSKIIVDGVHYNITDPENKTVELTYDTQYNCTYNGDFTIPETVAYNNETYTVTGIGDDTFNNVANITTVTIPNTVTYIGRYAFAYSALNSIIIPASVTSIDTGAFACDMESIVVEDGNSIYDSRDNCNAIIVTSTNTLIAGSSNTIIPNTVTTIGTHSFFQHYKLTSITIPSSVEKIEWLAFMSTCLTTITVEATTPPVLEDLSFGTFDATVYVPADCVETYKADNYWSKFSKIVEIGYTEVSLDTDNFILSMKNSKLLNATVIPADKEIVWKSSNENVATITPNGTSCRITSVAEGEAMIIAALSDSTAIADTCVVTVKKTLAEVEPTAFETINGITCENKWILSKNFNKTNWDAFPINCTEYYSHYEDNLLQNATIYGDGDDAKIIMDNRGFEGIFHDGDGDGIVQESGRWSPHISILDLKTGAFENNIHIEGAFYASGFDNHTSNIGVDSYGHLWYQFNGGIYLFENIESAPNTLIGQFSGSYFAVEGDITSEQSSAIITNGTNSWKREQGSSEWVEFTDNNTSLSKAKSETVEFSLGNRNFVAYYMDAPDADGNQVCIAELTADNDIANATKYWTLHSEGVGTSCTGHNLSIKKITDTKGNESVYLFSFCKNNGYALYQISQETFNKPNTFAVEDFRIKRDSTFTMPVAMLNDSTITAFQCDIVLPQGITVTKTDDVIDVTLADERNQDHTINAELLDDGTLRVISSSLTLAQYTGNSGNLFNIGLTVDENGVDGKHTIEIKNIKLSSVTGSQCNAPATKATAEIYTFEQGDANGDHKIDVADVVSITQVILGKTEEAVNETVPDYNNDKVVDVFDIVEIIKYILSQQSTESQAVTMSAFETAKDAVSIESFTVDRFGTGTIDIALRNITPFTAFQMDLHLPKGLTVTAQRMLSRASSSHALLAQANGENSVRLLSYSSMTDTYGDNSGVLLSIDVKADETFEGNGMATINNITFADTHAQSYSLKNVAAQINMPTAIDDVYTATHVYAAGKVIVIESPTYAVATVSSVSGIAENIEIKAGKNVYEANAQGVYIVSLNGMNHKVILK